MKVALFQSSPKLNRSNLHEIANQIDQLEGVDVVVFPELALSGYLLQDKLFEDAWNVNELDILALKSEKCDIAIGAALWDEGKVYNSALYFSKGKLLHIHHKNYLPNYGMFEEGRYFIAGNRIDSFDTSFGKAVMVICEDLWRAETITKIVESEAEIVYVLSASPARGFENMFLEIESQWDALLKATALLTHNYVVFVNRVGFEDGLGFWGGSRVITPMGQIQFVSEKFKVQSSVVELNQGLRKLGRYLSRNS